jgi:isopentenyl-diphosphate delta-isomerase
MENTDSILLVDENDNITGKADKERVHKEGLLHRAFSIFVFNDDGELLMHKRSDSKYHSPGVWTNTCCSHQSETENEMLYIHERLSLEMGVDTELSFLFKHQYRAEFPNGLVENEYDHVYYGFFNGTPVPNPAEVSDWQWSDTEMLMVDISRRPENYSYWFKELLPLVLKHEHIVSLLD